MITFLQSGVSSGNSYTVPVSGVITSWSFQFAATAIAGLELKVASPVGGSSYTIVGQSTASAETANAVNTYPASIPVQAGDIIGIYNPVSGGVCANPVGKTAADTIRYAALDAAVDSTMSYATAADARIPVSVTVAQPPGVSSIAPSSGPTNGGTTVAITGHDFTGASAVSFGGTPAERFTVNSDTSITAVSTARSAGTVAVRVTTPGGQSPTTAADEFSYYIPQPAVTSVAPSKGPRTGGRTVTITGHDFAGATAVSFGGRPAKRFTVDSDTSVTAVSAAHAVGTVDVRVTTPGGQSPATAADRFTFTQVCVVPKLKGKTLKKARKALKKAHCSLGKASGPTTGRVKQQSRKRGKILPAGTKVNITLI